MSDNPSDSMTSRLRRNESRREPATIDLSAMEVRTETQTEVAASQDPDAGAASGLQDSAATLEAAGPADTNSRPTPDEVIPTDDAPASSPGPDLSSTSRGSTTVPPISMSEPRRQGAGFPALLAAGVLGGLLGAGGVFLAESWWRPQASGVDSRVAQLEQRLAATPQPSLGPIESRMSRLEADNKALGDRLNATQALAERSAKQAQEALNRPAPQPAQSTEAAAGASVLADLATRISALEKQVQDRAHAATNVQERLGTIQQQTQTAASAAQALERRIADQDQRLAALAKQFSERGPDAMAASLRVTLADRLGDALQEGTPVGEILAALRRLNVKPDTLQPLEPYAQAAPPSAAALLQEFRPLGQRMIAETRPPADDWGERVWRMLDKVVTVRAVGDPASTDVASLVARIEDALSRDEVGEAAKTWDALPEPARRVAPDWGAKLKRRAAAEAATKTIYAEALSALEASTR